MRSTHLSRLATTGIAVMLASLSASVAGAQVTTTSGGDVSMFSQKNLINHLIVGDSLEVEMAQLALTRTQNAAVKEFANSTGDRPQGASRDAQQTRRQERHRSRGERGRHEWRAPRRRAEEPSVHGSGLRLRSRRSCRSKSRIIRQRSTDSRRCGQRRRMTTYRRTSTRRFPSSRHICHARRRSPRSWRSPTSSRGRPSQAAVATPPAAKPPV